MTLKLTKQYKRKMMKKILTELPLYRSSLEYNTRLTEIPDLPLRKYRTAELRRQTMQALIQSVEQALSLLSDTERRIIELHYYEEHTFFDIEEIVHLERSSVYRYHASAMDKLATAILGD